MKTVSKAISSSSRLDVLAVGREAGRRFDEKRALPLTELAKTGRAMMIGGKRYNADRASCVAAAMRRAAGITGPRGYEKIARGL